MVGVTYMQYSCFLRRGINGIVFSTVILVALLSCSSIMAANIQINADCNLVQAINSANEIGGDTGTCLAGDGSDTIILEENSIYTLDKIENGTGTNANGLPVIISDITINGNNSTIQRVATTDFRFFTVGLKTLTLNNLIIRYGVAEKGGAIIVTTGDLTINNCSIMENSASNGGGIYIIGGTASITNSTISENVASEHGGGIHLSSGGLFITNNTISKNSASMDGGGLYTGPGSGSVTMNRLTISENMARNGGGVSSFAGDLNLYNTTVSENTAIGNGGGIHTYLGNLTLLNATLYGNKAVEGGGLYSAFSINTVTLKNTIITKSTGNDCFLGDSNVVETHNWFEGGACNSIAQGDPTMDVLKDNGGLTYTHALISGSGAVDAGLDAVCADVQINSLDQRGQARPDGEHCDIGAFEGEVQVADESGFYVVPANNGNVVIFSL